MDTHVNIPPYGSDWAPTETLVTIDFFDRDGSTEVRLTHEMYSDENMRDEHDEGWGRCLDSLTRYLTIALSSGPPGDQRRRAWREITAQLRLGRLVS